VRNYAVQLDGFHVFVTFQQILKCFLAVCRNLYYVDADPGDLPDATASDGGEDVLFFSLTGTGPELHEQPSRGKRELRLGGRKGRYTCNS
jgi:hypothetical protein